MKKSFLLFLSIWIGITSCNDPITVGSDILNETSVGVEFRDDLPISAETIDGEPSITFRNFDNGSFSGTNYMVGVMDDDVFGRSEAVTYFTTTLTAIPPLFSDDNLDSVVLNIPYDTLGFYGDETAVHELDVRMISEEVILDVDQALTADTIFPTTDVIASRTLIINPRDSFQLQAFTSDNPDSLVTVAPHLRIPLDKALWIDVFGAGEVTDNATYQTMVPGLSISSTPSTSSMFGLDLLYGLNSASSGNISFYITIDGERAIFNIPIGRIRHSTYTNDYAGSDLEANLGQQNPSLLYAQSQDGTDVAIDVSAVRTLNNSILNSGILRVSIEEEDNLDPIEGLFGFARDNEGDLIIVGAPLDLSNPLAERFENGESAMTYSLDVTSHLNNVREGLFANDTIFLIAASKTERPNRTIILGTDHPNFPLGLDLILTNP